MLSPTVRAWLHVFKAYGTDLKRYLNFVENPSDFIIFKLHRVLRNRRQLLAGLASGKDQQNGGSTAADEMRTSLESEFSREFYRGVDTDAMLTRIGVKASEFFETRTAFAFENPAILAFGLADVKGDAGRTADELVTMARQGPLIGLLEGYANNLHAEVGTEMVRAAIFEKTIQNTRASPPSATTTCGRSWSNSRRMLRRIPTPRSGISPNIAR